MTYFALSGGVVGGASGGKKREEQGERGQDGCALQEDLKTMS
jgi:hypothetical protein